MLTILHAADLHLDAPFASLAPEQARRRRAEQRELLERLAALGEPGWLVGHVLPLRDGPQLLLS